MVRMAGIGIGAVAAVVAATPAMAAPLTWGGANGTWETGTVWRDAGGAPVAWADGDTAALDNTYGDATGRSITIANNNAVATGGINVTANGYTLIAGGTSATHVSGAVTIGSGVTLSIFGEETGSKRIRFDSISGAGTLDLINTLSSPTETQRRILHLSNDHEISTHVTISSMVPPGGFTPYGRRTGIEGMGAGSLVSGSITNNADDGTLTALGGTLTITGVIGGSNGVALSTANNFGGNADITLQATNTYEGDTHFLGAVGEILKLDSGAANTLPTTTRLFWGVPAGWPTGTVANPTGGRVDLNGLDQQVVALSRTTTGSIGGIHNAHATAASTLTISGADGQNGNYAGPLVGNINLVKAGASTQVLGGIADDVTYTGTTTVTGGTLAIDGDFSNATGDVTVSGGTLAGSGTIGGATTIATGGSHNAGNSAGTQAFNAALTYATGSTLVWELVADSAANAGTDFDLVDANAGFDIAAGALIDLVFNLPESTVEFDDAFWSTAQSWKIIDGTGTGAFTVASLLVTDADGDTLSGAQFSVSNETDGVYLNYAVPEPASLALLAMGGVATFGRGRRA